MSERLDHYIYETNFIGHGLVVLGVPGAAPLEWNTGHNGWDILIPADGQFLLTSTEASEVSQRASHQMRREDGSLEQLPYRTPTQNRPIAALGPASGPMAIDLDAQTYVQFWTFSPMTLCGPCPEGVVPAALTSRDAVRRAASTHLLARIRSRDIPIEALDIRETQ